ncbi:hypothetical protein [Arcanobacterium phocae]|uniref:Uncharacterized protein n=1 Tax=Arcanobacterium phocae TaxID=131112 RepID=A0A1H2LK10_9ACTO|nr:hypothetical protein [Arcanobacterium phocae]SDU80736.1 hypothetical protein SAMN04489737_1297 [Arcanobacterium phocae]
MVSNIPSENPRSFPKSRIAIDPETALTSLAEKSIATRIDELEKIHQELTIMLGRAKM